MYYVHVPSRVALCVACWPKNSQVAGSNRICICLCSEWRKSHSRCAAAADSFLASSASRSHAKSQSELPILFILSLVTVYYTMHSGGVDGMYICAFLLTIPLGVSTVPSSTRRMPEWILRPWPRVRFQFESKETHMEQHHKKIIKNKNYMHICLTSRNLLSLLLHFCGHYYYSNIL
jgi:hypothetical protein